MPEKQYKTANLHFLVYQVNAFTRQLFSGNPAMVCLLPYWPPDTILHAIAREHNLPVTVFLVRDEEQYLIRWITPEEELELCGHGSLAAGYVIFNHVEPSLKIINFQSHLTKFKVMRMDDQVVLDFPSKLIERIDLPGLAQSLGAMPLEVYQHHQERCLIVFDSEQTVRALKPDFLALQTLAHRGIVVTAPGQDVDFVSRTFYPRKNIPEDAVTGASHCLLAPYWSARLNKTALHALQISPRGGELFCRCIDDRVWLNGNAVLYLSGQASLLLK